MKILFFSPAFHPKTGGLESVAKSIAKGLAQHGFSIKLVTLTPLGNSEELNEGYEIVRAPSNLRLFKEYLKCNIFFHHNVSLKGLWPLIIYPKKWVVLHHLTYYDINGELSPLEWFKRNLTFFAKNVSVSNYVNESLPKRGLVIANPYDDDIFTLNPEISKEPKLLFVGRLVSDKGCLLLLRAISSLKNTGKNVKLTIVGDGPEKESLIEFCVSNKIDNLTEFLGVKKGKELANLYNAHQTLVIPSVWKEPFGVVALEGIACGCEVIASDGDGLTEALLGTGHLFKKNDLDDLIEKITTYHINCFPSDNITITPKVKNHSQNYTTKLWVSFFKKIHEG